MISVPGYSLQEKMRHNRNIDIYHALRKKDKRLVWLKAPPDHYSNISENLAILQHEFHLLNNLKKPSIIKAFDFLQYIPTPALILEPVKGQLLSNYLKEQELGISDFFKLALQLVDIIAELHQQQIIHKDIKPANFIIDSETMSLKLIDLSAAVKLYEESEHINFNFNEFSESLPYISPEQTGRLNRSVDYRSDFYSLGVTLFEMLTKQLPFQGTDPLEIIHCHIAKKPSFVLELRPHTPKMLALIIDKLLKKMPEERYSQIRGLKIDLLECQKQWLEKYQIAPFNLGLNDTKDYLTISRTLYGREKEVGELLQTFARVSKGPKEIVLIAGYSGIGKTSLVKEVHKPIVQHKGYYIQGKFDQLQRSIPYSAIVMAFEYLVKQVLSESEQRLLELKQQLEQALGNVGQIVVDVIPDIELIIGKQPPVRSLNPTDAQIRFNLVFQNLVRVFAQASHPLVIFLDDLQWADNSSLYFIENLLQDRETNHLLIIGAYRDNEVDENHPLQLSINNLTKNKANLTRLTLQPLQMGDIQQLLHDTLAQPTGKIKEFCSCIFNKTHGNPFFINQFIKILHQEKMLTFSYDKSSWEWDIEKIKQQSATDNVIDLLTSKIHLLPPATQETLKIASCLSHEFDLKTLMTISGQSISITADQLTQAIQASLIYPLEQTYKTLGLIGLTELPNFNLQDLRYRFAHDRIQQACYQLIQEQERPKIHLNIGRLLLKEKSLVEHDERLFDIMKHFNQAINLITKRQERHLLATYNLWAGQKAKLASAEDTANDYLSAGVELLQPVNWTQDYDLAFNLYKELAVCKYLIGQFKAADTYFSLLLNNASDELDKIEIYRLKIEMLSTLGRHAEALDIGLAALRAFDIKIPKKPNFFHLVFAIFKIKFQLRKAPIEQIDLPPMENLKQKAIVNLITQLFNSAFITNQQLFVLLTCKNISLSLKYGYTESTSMCIPVYAFVIMHSLGLYKDALAFVKLYNQLKHKYGASNFEGKNQFVLGTFIEPYHSPLDSCNETVRKAFRLCCEVGDLVYSNYSNLLLIAHTFFAGRNIQEVKKHIQATLSFMTRVKISDFLTVTKFWDFSTHCLEDGDLADVTESFAIYEENIIKEKSLTELSFFYAAQTRFLFLVGNYKEAAKIGAKHEIYSEYDKGLIIHLDGKFFYALALCYCAAEDSVNMKIYVRQIKKIKLLIEKYARWCPENYQAYALLLQAEFLSLNRNGANTLTLYEAAIETALANDLVLVAAIANEGASRYCGNKYIERIAKLYMQNAYRYYKNWGLLAKVSWLEKNYPSFNLANNESDSIKMVAKNSMQNLDMLAILKFTQLISSEIRLDKLLQKFLLIVLENAGAQRSVILVKEQNHWVIEAEGNLEHQAIYLTHSPKEVKYPQSLVNYVQHTQKSIIVNDALQSEIVFQDPYVQKEKPRSLLLMPLFYQGQLCRLLYLENKSSSHTFTPNHLDSLHLLSSQAMTSLENAKLYYQATHDPLTGLANRNMLYEIFQQTTKQIARSKTSIALLFLDLDYFKVTNDTLGHDSGDKLLIYIANTLTKILREGDIAARLGGDEFVIMLTNINSHDQVTQIAARLSKQASKPVTIDNHLIQITLSMGISIYPQDGNDIQTLLKLADTALYQAKEKGRNQFHYYSTELYEEYQRLHGLDKELQRAYDNQEFFLMYQPFYNTTTGKILGLESLLRWNHPEKGLLEANEFIHTLEKSPLIIPVGEWVIKTVCQQAKIWRDKRIFDGSIAINVSAIQFLRQSISQIMAEILTETKLHSSAIEFEITETILMENNDKLYKEIELLQKLGIPLAIDDFGTGYSALSYLKRLPVNKIKIDKAFISNCQYDYLDQTIINAVTTMAHKLNIQVIAEGVENEIQLRILQAQGIDGIQGYYYSRPLTKQDCEAYLTKLFKLKKPLAH